MNLLILQRLDQAGGGSRASLATTLRALRETRPEWGLALATQNAGPLGDKAIQMGVSHFTTAMPHFRKLWQRPAFAVACRRLAARASAFKPDVVLSNEWVTAPHALEVARRLHIPAMSYVRDFAAVTRGRKYQLHRMDRLYCVSESMRQAMIGTGYDPEKVRAVYNPVLPPEGNQSDEALRARILERTHVDRWLFYLGRISPRKNQIEAVETLRHLRDITGERWGLLLAGDADEGYETKLDHMIEALGLSAEVLKLGLVEKPGWLFEMAEAFVMTSKSEGLARVLIESFLCGKPAFAMPQDGLEDIYADAIPLFVPSSREPADLAEKIAASLADGDSLESRTREIRNNLEIRHSLAGHVASLEAALRMD
jgi:glycosyltransferase involved in cell wall biosynthesis